MFFNNFEEKISQFTKKQSKEIQEAIQEIENIFYSDNLEFEDKRVIELLSKNPLIRKDDYGVTLNLEENVTLKYYWGNDKFFEKLYIFNILGESNLSFFVFCDILNKKEEVEEIDIPFKQYGKFYPINYNIKTNVIDYGNNSTSYNKEYKVIIENFEKPEINEILALLFDFKLEERENLNSFYNQLNIFKESITKSSLENENRIKLR